MTAEIDLDAAAAAAPAAAPPPDRAAAAASESSNPHHARRWLILVVLALAQLMVVLDATIVNIAMPSAQRALAFTDGDRQWLVTGYSLAFGSLLLLGGRLGDLIGRKLTFLIGVSGFALASAVGGAATGFGMLVAARVSQGAFAALLAPAALSLLTTTFTDRSERGKAFGVFGAVAGAGGALGLLLGGVLTEYLSWRWCLYINLFFALIAAVAGYLLLVRETNADRPKLDIPGTLTVTAGLFALVYGFSRAETSGWTSALTLGSLAASVILLATFVWLQTSVSHALLPLRVLADRNRAGSLVSLLVTGAGMFGVFLFLTYYLTISLGYSPVSTGVAFLPMVGALALTSTLSTAFILPRMGPRNLVTVGMLSGGLAMVGFTRLALDSSYLVNILPPLLLMGFGMGLVFSTSISTATLGISTEDAGVGSALVSTAQQVGGSIGTALLNTLFASAVTSYLVDKTPSAALAAQATLHGYSVAFWWSAGIFASGAVISGFLLRPGILEILDDHEPSLAH